MEDKSVAEPLSLASMGMPEVFLFEYGVVIIWGIIEEKKDLLQLLVPYKKEKFSKLLVFDFFFLSFFLTRN